MILQEHIKIISGMYSDGKLKENRNIKTKYPDIASVQY